MDQKLIHKAGESFDKLKSRGVFDLTQAQLEEMGFDQDRYLNEGPGKHAQKDDGVKTTGMFAEWASDLMEQLGLEGDDTQDQRLVAEFLYRI
jgi:hypothetical protein